MAYNRENLLERIIEIQKIVKEHKKRYVPQVRIYKEYVQKQYHISYATFNNYLGVPAYAELMKLRAKKESQK